MAVETRYYLCDRVGTGAYGNEFRARDVEKMQHLKPAMHVLVDKPVVMLEIKAETAQHDALDVPAAVKLVSDVQRIDAAAVSNWLSKAGMDTSWVTPLALASEVVYVIFREIRSRQRENALIYAPTLQWVIDERLRLVTEMDAQKTAVKGRA